MLKLKHKLKLKLMRTDYSLENSLILGKIESRRHLLLGRKAMTNLDSVLKSRDITLLTKICIAKAMIFLLVMYGCES